MVSGLSTPVNSMVVGSDEEGSSFHWSSSASATIRPPSPDSRTAAVSALAVRTGVDTSPPNAPHSICRRMNSITRLCVTATRPAIGCTPDWTLSDLRVSSGNPPVFGVARPKMLRLATQGQGLRKAG